MFPESSDISHQGNLTIGGCDVLRLVAEFGTPLYLYDEAMVRSQAQRFREAFESRLPNSQVVYACKAGIIRALARIVADEGLGADIVSAGELAILESADFPMRAVYFHGNNKGADELHLALRKGVGRIVVDNFHELELLNDLAIEAGQMVTILLRVSPGIDPHTHSHTTTGIVDSKFGFTMANGQAAEAVVRAQAASHIELVGLHTHLGSPIFELEPYELGVRAVFDFAAEMREQHKLAFHEFSPGGGFAVQYVVDSPAPEIESYAESIAQAVRASCKRTGFDLPRVMVEPGRAIVGRAGVALYTIGAVKDIPSVRKYVSVDGGMADNIRPAIYGSKYEAIVANKPGEPNTEVVTIAGKYCESGDILVKDIALPATSAGDVIAIPVSGAYCLAMSSHYNSALDPAVIFVKDGEARLVRRRETYEDLMRCDLS